MFPVKCRSMSEALLGVLLVEDDVPTRQWLAAEIAHEPDLVVSLACGSVREAMDWLRAGNTPAVVLTDLGLSDGSGLQVIEFAAKLPHCDVLVLSIFGDEANVLAAIDAGASGYLLKDGSVPAISEHLRCLRSGGSPLSPRIARTLIRRTRVASAPQGEAIAETDLLTSRERDVLTGIGKGFSYAEVATMLDISTNTVRTHVRHIYEKLAVNSGLEALYEYNRRTGDASHRTIR